MAKAKVVDNLQKLIDTATATMDDAEKFEEKGNGSTGTRVRKAMQDIKSIAQEIRQEVSEMKADK